MKESRKERKKGTERNIETETKKKIKHVWDMKRKRVMKSSEKKKKQKRDNK